MALDPVSIAAIMGGIKTLGGVAQTALSGQKQAERDLKNQIEAIPEYVKSPSILEYYEQARQRFGLSPSQTSMYKRQMENIRRAGATGLANIQSARGRISATPSTVRSMADASLAAEVAGEQEKNRRFGQLGAAAQMMRGEDVMKQQRELMRREQFIRQAAARAAGRAAVQRAGITNIFGGLGDIGKAGLSQSESDSSKSILAALKKLTGEK